MGKKLLGYNYSGRPIHRVGTPVLKLKPIYRQGCLYFFPFLGLLQLNTWDKPWFFDHRIIGEAPEDEFDKDVIQLVESIIDQHDIDDVKEKQQVITKDGMLIKVQGEMGGPIPMAVLRLTLDYNAVIHSKGREDIIVPPGDYLVAHSLERGNMNLKGLVNHFLRLLSVRGKVKYD